MVTYFNGQRLVSPQAASVIDESAMLNPNVTQPAGVVALIGQSTNGPAQAPVMVTDPAQARRIFGSGELVDACERAFAPSGGSPGAGAIVALRVNPALQSSLVLVDTTSGTALNAINLKSRDYGAVTNLLRVSVGTPVGSPTPPGKAITLAYNDVVLSNNSVGYAALRLQGTPGQGTIPSGATVKGVVSYPGGAGQLALIYTVSSTPTTDFTLTFAQYPTLQALADAINAKPGYSAVVTYYQSNPQPPTNPAPATVLDDQTVTGMEVAPGASLRADVVAAVDWFNQYAGNYVTATRAAVGTKPLASITQTYFTSGSDGSTPSNNDWSNCLTALQGVDAHVIVPVSASATIHSLVQAHVDFMSTVASSAAGASTGRRERIGVVGGALGETPASGTNALTRANAMQSSRMVVVAPGVQDYDRYGNLTTYAPYMVAAQLAGLIAGLPVQEAITRRYIRAFGIEQVSAALATGAVGTTQLTQGEREAWLAGGVCVLEQVPNRGVRVVQGHTTWSADLNYVRSEISVRRATDWIARRVREACDAYLVGQTAGPDLQGRVVSLVDGILRQLYVEHVIVGDLNHPPYRNINANTAGDTVRVDFECSPAIPANFILITVHPIPFSTVA